MFGLNHGWLDGASFFCFFKKGGLDNLLGLFKWLGDLLPVVDSDYYFLAVNLFDQSCLTLKALLQALIISRNQDTNTQSLLNMNMGNEFENPKVFYQTFYHRLISTLLNFSSSSDQQ